MHNRVDFHGIQALRRELDFPAVAKLYKLIPEPQISLCVDYQQEGHAALADLITDPTRAKARKVQQYVVQVPQSEEATLVSLGLAVMTPTGIYRWHGDYDEQLLGIKLG